MNPKKLLAVAYDAYDEGDLDRVKDLCKKILAKKRNDRDALHLLAMSHFRSGNHDLALRAMERVLAVDPRFADAYNNLGNIYQSLGKLDTAVACYRTALRYNPELTGAYLNLGIVLQDLKKLDEAVSCYRNVIARNPKHAGAFNNLGLALHEIGNVGEAIDCYRQAIQNNPTFAEAYNNLGLAFKDEGYIDAAIEHFRRALDLDSRYRDAHNNLAGAYHSIGQLSEALFHYRKAVEIDHRYVHGWNNIGTVMTDQGLLLEAQEYFRRALQIDPHYQPAISNILFTMIYSEDNSPGNIAAEHLRVASMLEDQYAHYRIPHRNIPERARTLKIGYVSADFKTHSVGYFIEPILAGHSSKDFETYCYSDVVAPDETTRRMKSRVHTWSNIAGKTDEDVAALVREHEIDILVDLAGHTAKNRISLFARKPAPIQVSWIGYPATTGLRAMDYKIVDRYTDPPGLTDHLYTERLVRLPDTFLCYLPDADSPEVCPPPCLSTGHVTFGSFNNFPKVSPLVFRMWQRILQRLPSSRLVMKARSLADPTVCRRVLSTFKNAGISEDRIELLSWKRSRREHLELYSRVDIALDTFPYHGTTTTCEALWMGVPVVTLAGKTHASRVGVSLLTNAGLPDLIAQTEEEYIEKALALAEDIERLRFLRFSLRDTLLRSPLTNAPRFIENLEKCYRDIWRQWCSERLIGDSAYLN